MNIAVIAPNPTFQTEQLKAEAKKKGHSIDRIRFPEISITRPQNDKTIASLLKYDIVYFRNGADLITKMILGKTLIDKGKFFINSGYYTKPLLANKIYQMFKSSEAGILTPQTITSKIFHKNSFQEITERIGLPFIMKPASGAKGKGLYLIETQEQFEKECNHIRPYKTLFQEYVPNDGDYRVLVIGGNPAGTFKRTPPDGDFRSNISRGGTGSIVEDKHLIKQLYEIAKKTTALFDLEIAGIDVIKSQKNEKLYLIETNSIPQWQGFYKTTHINIAQKIVHYFEKHVM